MCLPNFLASALMELSFGLWNWPASCPFLNQFLETVLGQILWNILYL